MGLRIASMYLLEYGKRKYGLDFSETLSLGRQFHAFNKNELNDFFCASGIHSLNNNKFFETPFAEDVFETSFGSKIHSLDAFDYEGAEIIHDMNCPIPKELKGKYSCVVDGGTTEHIFDFPQALKNSMDLLRLGGHFISMVPTNNFNGHGFYQFSPELFFRIFNKENGFVIEDIFLVKFTAGKKLWRIKNTPEEFGERIQFNLNIPSELFVVAKKIAERPETIIVQQTDYAKNWYKEDGGENKKSPRDSLTGKIPRKLLFFVGQFLYHPIHKNRFVEKMNMYKILKKGFDSSPDKRD